MECVAPVSSYRRRLASIISIVVVVLLTGIVFMLGVIVRGGPMEGLAKYPFGGIFGIRWGAKRFVFRFENIDQLVNVYLHIGIAAKDSGHRFRAFVLGKDTQTFRQR